MGVLNQDRVEEGPAPSKEQRNFPSVLQGRDRVLFDLRYGLLVSRELTETLASGWFGW